MSQSKPSIPKWVLPGAFLLIAGLGVYALWYSKQPVEPRFSKEGELSFGRKDSLGKMVILTKIDLEFALSTSETMQGLMYRSSMEEDQGMIFVFPEMAERSFWMKNTKISLDILYADNQGKIVSIQENTVPFSEEPIPSNALARYVIEVNAGYCQRHDIRPGDYVNVEDMRKKD